MSKAFQRCVDHGMIPSIPDIPALYCEETRGGQAAGGVILVQLDKFSLLPQQWPSNPLPVAKCLVWSGRFIQIKPERLKGDFWDSWEGVLVL